jgi:hypothetical protein
MAYKGTKRDNEYNLILHGNLSRILKCFLLYIYIYRERERKREKILLTIISINVKKNIQTCEAITTVFILLSK